MSRLPSFADLQRRFPLAVSGWRRAIPYVQQSSATECGVTCLAMILAYHGRRVTLQELRLAAVSPRDATNAQKLIETARTYGLRGRAVSVDIGQLEFLQTGAMLHWRFSHFVVFERLTSRAVHIVDPARGRRCVSLDQFGKSFTGVAIVFEPVDGFQKTEGTDRPLLRYLKHVLTERGFLPHVLMMSLLIQGLGLGLPLANRALIDYVIPRKDYNLFLIIGLGLAFILLFQACASIVRAHLLLYLRARLDSRLTLSFLEHLLTLPFDFFQRRSAGDLLMRLSSNATVRQILTGTVLSGALDGTLAVSYVLVLFALSIPVALLTCCLATAQMLLFAFSRRQRRQSLAEALEAQARSQGYLVETLSAIELLKTMGLEDRVMARYSGLFVEEMNAALKRGRLDAFIEAATGFVRTGSTMALLSLGASQVLDGTLTVGDMIAMTAIANGFLVPLMNLASSTTQLQQLAVYLQRLDDVFQAAPERPAALEPPGSRIGGSISVDNVTFRYGPVSSNAVENVSLQIGCGELVAIVGRSASGKSTLARLLVGLYVPNEGRICHDDIDMRALNLASLRRQIGVVTQQPYLFSGTIRSNIAVSNPLLPLEDVVRAAKLAQIHDEIVAMPMGYETPLSDRGASLSGGQQQRLCVARALATNPRVLLLDEATSQLDAIVEQALHTQLRALACTRVVIAHRLSTIMHADRIVVMDAGKVVEQGSHAELLTNGRLYRELVAAQLPSAESVR